MQKYNKPCNCTFNKSTKFGQPPQAHIRTAQIEEVEDSEEEEVSTSIARVARFDEDQHEQ